MCLMLALCVGVYGCPSESSNNGELDAGEDVVSDVEDDDGGGEDAEADVSACDPACTNGRVCDESLGECVDCLGDEDCDTGVCGDGVCVPCTVDKGCGSDEVCAVDDADPQNSVCAACIEGEGCADGEICAVDDTSPGDSVCTECESDADCTESGAEYCEDFGDDDVTTNACVECTSDDHCTDPAASTCNDSNECVPCTTDDECAGISAGGVCDTSGAAGECVECLIGQEAACTMSGECDPDTRECVQRTTGSKSVCEECSSDDECAAYHYCVPMEYTGGGSAVDVGSYCLKLVSAGCGEPFLGSVNRSSVAGGSPSDYCAIDESIATCAAYNSFKAGTTCGNDNDCGHPSASDGLCERIDNGTEDRCTYSCASSTQCPTSFSCGSGSFCTGL
jgi:hypothetical protein